MASEKNFSEDETSDSSIVSSPTSIDDRNLDILCDLKKVRTREGKTKEELEGEERQHVISEPTDLDRITTRQSYRSYRSFRKVKDEEKAGEILDPDNPDSVEETIPSEYLVDWNGQDDPQNPLNWKMRYKAFALATVALQTLTVVYYSTSYVAGSPGMAKDFNVTSEIKLISGVTTYLSGLALGPLLLAPLSEIYGRRPVYLVSYFIFFILTIPVCLAKNFSTIVAIRFFAGLSGSSTISNAGGTLADIFQPRYRATAFSIFAIAPMNGPSFGPIVGGFVYEYLGWRWTNWLVMIFAGVMGTISIFLKETYAPTILRKKAAAKRKETGDVNWRSHYDHAPGTFMHLITTNLTRPLIMLFTEPICIFWALYISIVYSILYMSFVAYPIIFTDLRGWSPGFTGLSYLGILVGTFCAIACDPFVRYVYNRHKVDPVTGKIPPEALIWSICIGAFLIPTGIIWFAWTGEPSLGYHWMVPIASGIPFGMGNTFVFIHGNNYLLNSYGIYAASALAGNTVTRSLLGGIIPLFTTKMYSNLGPTWAGTLCAALAFVLIPIPLMFYKWGSKFRARSPMLLALEKGRQECEN